MQKLFTALAFSFLLLSLAGCGTTKKQDSEEELGMSDGKLRDGGGSGGGNPTPPIAFETYCTRLQGQMISSAPKVCKYQRGKSEVVTYPDDFTGGIFRQDVGVAKRGWLVQTQGDDSNAAELYEADNGNLSFFLPINGQLRKRRMEADAHGLVLMATAKFTKPATISIFECLGETRDTVLCPLPQ